MLLARVSAQLALDVAAPDELAVALLGDVAHASLVAPAAAEQPTAIQAKTRAVADPASGARDAQPVWIDRLF